MKQCGTMKNTALNFTVAYVSFTLLMLLSHINLFDKITYYKLIQIKGQPPWRRRAGE